MKEEEKEKKMREFYKGKCGHVMASRAMSPCATCVD